jgi:hypothetical protein
MIEDMIQRVEAAIKAAEHWHETGWPARFGARNVEVRNLKEAEALPRTAVYKLEAVNYWKQVRLAGIDTAESGRKALEALKGGDHGAAGDALYFCQYIEAPFAGYSNTWKPLFEAFRSSSAA